MTRNCPTLRNKKGSSLYTGLSPLAGTMRVRNSLRMVSVGSPYMSTSTDRDDVGIYLHRTLGRNHPVHGGISKGVEAPVRAPHEIRFQQVAAVAVVLELALVQLHRQVRRLEVQGHHLAASVPEHLRGVQGVLTVGFLKALELDGLRVVDHGGEPGVHVGGGARVGHRGGRIVPRRRRFRHYLLWLRTTNSLVLLGFAAVVLEGQYDGVVRGDEGGVAEGVDDVFEEDVGAHRHAVGYDRLFIFAFAVPAVEFHAATREFNRDMIIALAAELPARKIRVVGRVDVVMGQRLVHVHIVVQPVQEHRRVLVRHQKHRIK
ncbi:hypothetical protein MSG28_004463 [Choristoneura fumiferana]|uniref:Uncharacterized protein n=1 Tax=Choristoneura fumiferana TaxID=7141 RepID=A0ACC0K6M8_CHOFU|nr:hypothetical protein MSG28_004463 [Choristoneura fumiferana]